jgi:hypothetical protein
MVYFLLCAGATIFGGSNVFKERGTDEDAARENHFFVDMIVRFLYNLAVTVLVSISCSTFYLAVSRRERVM